MSPQKNISHHMYMSHIEKPKASSRERSRRLLEDVEGRRSVIKNFIMQHHSHSSLAQQEGRRVLF